MPSESLVAPTEPYVACEFGECDGIDALLAILRYHLSNATVLEQACLAIVNATDQGMLHMLHTSVAVAS